MPTKPQIRGVLLEEILLYLLQSTGYCTVTSAAGDDTLDIVSAGLVVHGRGADHQIDAIADYLIQQPFAHPQRLLVEAKCFKSDKVDLKIVRNALGTLRDVCEFWVKQDATNGGQRYHYQYAVFSVSGYTRPAQEYAFAQDIYLIQLAQSAFLKPLIAKLSSAAEAVNELDTSIKLKTLRQQFRSMLARVQVESDEVTNLLEELRDLCHNLGGVLLATIAGQFPIFLVPATDLDIATLSRTMYVKIFFDQSGWYLRDLDDKLLFSFDLPAVLFNQYAESGRLSPAAALNLKENALGQIQAIRSIEGRVDLLSLKLDGGWLTQVKRQIRHRIGSECERRDWRER